MKIKETKNYWKSLKDWESQIEFDPEFEGLVRKEFQSTPLSQDKEEGWARREFLKLMGASLALTGLSCVRRPTQKIVPYVKRPQHVVPGRANYYSSSVFDGTEVTGVLVKTREGRPIKAEGHPDYPEELRRISIRGQASVLNLYDPDRVTSPVQHLFNEKKTNYVSLSTNWKTADKHIKKELQKGAVGLFTSTILSPATRALIYRFRDETKAKAYTWDAESLEDVRNSYRQVYGKSLIPSYRLDKAQMILSIGADFLGSYLAPTEMTARFSKTRRSDRHMGELVVCESGLSLTGSNADTRYAVPASQYLSVLMHLLHELIVVARRSRYSGDSAFKKLLTQYVESAPSLSLDPKQLAHKLWNNRRKSVVIAGGLPTQTHDSMKIQIATHILNEILGNHGRTIDLQSTYQTYKGANRALSSLVRDIRGGRVKRLIVHGVNLAFVASHHPQLMKALESLELLVYTGHYKDDTALKSHFVVPDHHPLENWGDFQLRENLYSIQQPTIRPLYETRSFQDSLITWGNIPRVKDWHSYLKTYWRYRFYSKHKKLNESFEFFWARVLKKGFIKEPLKFKGASLSFNTEVWKVLKNHRHRPQGLELSLYPSVALRDGSLSNVSWLQELPDPVTKICWDNYASVSLQLAESLKLKEGQVVRIKVGPAEVRAPVHIQPGQEENSISIAVGYGQSWGQVNKGVGVNAYPLVEAIGIQRVFAGLPCEIIKTSESVLLASTQEHHTMHGRDIVREQTLDQFLHSDEVSQAPKAKHHPSLWGKKNKPQYKGQKWGMTIDLSRCTGCSACVIACQSENNIPTVGKKYIAQGREMHWMRVDRYYAGEPKDNPDSLFMPVLCQHCDQAPCETVCPVAATVHGEEGTNDMIYNRCVGTRYCANNCPYKVRRFNWFDYTKLESPLHKALNPEVTVRDRGVMEKCTFCHHRVVEARRDKQNKGGGKHLQDGEVQTACQQACPAQAITFGDTNNSSTQVAKKFKDRRSYSLLDELNVGPSVRYQKKIRNAKHTKVKSGGH